MSHVAFKALDETCVTCDLEGLPPRPRVVAQLMFVSELAPENRGELGSSGETGTVIAHVGLRARLSRQLPGAVSLSTALPEHLGGVPLHLASIGEVRHWANLDARTELAHRLLEGTVHGRRGHRGLADGHFWRAMTGQMGSPPPFSPRRSRSASQCRWCRARHACRSGRSPQSRVRRRERPVGSLPIPGLPAGFPAPGLSISVLLRWSDGSQAGPRPAPVLLRRIQMESSSL